VFAKNLENVLAALSNEPDVSGAHTNDISKRFDVLRGYGRLPRGRVNRAKRLTPTEMSAAIFALVPHEAREAGIGAIVLSDLRPVGGVRVSFYNAPSLSAAVECLLTDASARSTFVDLRLSTTEIDTNCHGFARLVYEKENLRQQVNFVHKLAVTNQQPGAERTFDADESHPWASKAVVFSRAFFERLALLIGEMVGRGDGPAGDGSEYDAEEAEQARLSTLGVKRGSRYLNIGVNTQVTWPKNEMLIEFDKYQLVLLPKTKENAQSVHIDTHAHRISDEDARTVINRFLSVLAWCDDQHAVAQGGWSGSKIPSPVRKRNFAFATAHEWPFRRSIPPSDKACRALALYRDGLNSEAAELVGYSVLSYFKVIEINHPEGKQAKRWIAANFAAATKASSMFERMKLFVAACDDVKPEVYIYEACRVAVAHASPNHISDIDDAKELTRLFTAAFVLRLLARHLIETEFQVSDSILSDAVLR
jgi:hypothetical protein